MRRVDTIVVDAWFLFTASPNLNRALLQFLTVSDFRLHIAALLHSNRMTNRQSTHDASLPFWRHNHPLRTNNWKPLNDIRIVSYPRVRAALAKISVKAK